MKKKYTHYFFDLDGTLWDLYKNTEIALRKLTSQMGAFTSEEEFAAFYRKYHFHNEKVWALYRVGKIEKSELRTVRFERAFKDAGWDLSAAELEKFATDFLDLCPRLPHLLDGAHELLSFLQPMAQIHIITNGFKEVQGFKMEGGNLNQYISTMINSEDAGKRKPSPEIFEYALRITGATKENSIMIGDDWDADIIGARDFGMDQAFITNTEVHQAKLMSNGSEYSLPRHNYSPTFTVNTLTELKEKFQ